jgi:hypothetical protein
MALIHEVMISNPQSALEGNRFITTEPCSNPGSSWFILGKSSPFMAERFRFFRLVKSSNLPR